MDTRPILPSALNPQPSANGDFPLACQTCGRRDETVRLSVFPYVISVVFATFRRKFVGVWCRRHRLWKWLIASLITVSIGWLGIPFGFIFTPFALWQLLRGGEQKKHVNAELLHRLGEQKIGAGDYQGGIRCLEESLRIEDSQAVSERLSSMPQYLSTQEKERAFSGVVTILVFGSLPFVLGIVGLLLGILDYILGRVILTVTGGSENIFVAIISWVPLVIMFYFIVVIIKFLLERLLKTVSTVQPVLGTTLAFISSLFAIYSVLTGEALGSFVALFFQGWQFNSLLDILFAFGSVLTHGGIYQLYLAVIANQIWGIIYVVIYFVFACLSLVIAIPASFETVTANIRVKTALSKRMMATGPEPHQLNSGVGWVGMVFAATIIVLGFILFPQKSQLDVVEAVTYVYEGNNALSEGDYYIAIKKCQEASRLNPHSTDAYLCVGFAYYSKGENDNAVSSFEQALAINPDLVGAHMGLGMTYLMFDPPDLDGAIQEFDIVVASLPDYPLPHVGLGMAYTGKGDLTRAMEEHSRAHELDPGNSAAYMGKGIIHLYYWEKGLALAAFQKAVEIDSQNSEAYLGLGQTYFLLGNYDGATENFEKVIQLDPYNSTAHLYLGMICEAHADFNCALMNYKKAHGLDPASGQVHTNLMTLYYAMDRQDDMEAELEEARASDLTDPYMNYAIGNALAQMAQYSAAEPYLIKAIDVLPEDLRFQPYASLAILYARQGKFDQAQNAIDAAKAIRSDSVIVLLTQAEVAIEKQEFRESADILEAILAKDDQEYMAHDLLSFVYYKLGRVEDGIREAESALSYNKFDAGAYAGLAISYLTQGKVDQAEKAALESVRLNPANDLAHYVLGVCYMQRGMKENAIVEFEKFMKYYSNSAYDREYKPLVEEYMQQLCAAP